MKKPVFEGVATALVTPFKNGTIDLPTLQKLMDRQIAAGIDAIVVCGTTGEAATLTAQEQLTLISHAIDYAAGRCKIIAGTGSNSTAHALEMSQMASSLGADALLLVTPYYNKCTQTGLIEHYTAIADRVKTPVIVYNVPSRTGLDISVETCQILAEHPNINRIKEASPSIKAARILNACGDALFLWSGNDDAAVPLMALGGKGLISVLSRPPGRDAGHDQKLSARRLCPRWQVASGPLMPLIDALFCEVNLSPSRRPCASTA